MSAYVVDDEHIHTLIHAGLTIPRGYTLSWVSNDEQLPTPENGLQNAIRGKRRVLDYQSADVVGQILLAENYRSVNYRYDEEEIDTLYHYRKPRIVADPVQVLKAIRCLEYQSCEHPEWEQSEAWAFLQALQGFAINALPGYDDAKWSISA